MTLQEFKELTKKENLKCTFCHSSEIEVTEHEYEHEGAALKFTFWCKNCDITVSGYIY
jgi:transcriptional regulator NrdR family protein